MRKSRLFLLPIFAMALGALLGCDAANQIASMATDIQSQITDLQSDVDALKNEVENLKKQITDLEGEMNESIAKVEADYKAKIEVIETNISALQKEINDLTAKLEVDNKELSDDYNAKISGLETGEETARQELENDYNTKINNLQTTYEAKVAEIEGNIATERERISALQTEMANTVTSIQNDYNGKINELTCRVATLEQVRTHTVTFDTQGGSVIDSTLIIHGEKVNKPTNPTRPGFTFEGWTYLNEPWVFQGYVVTEDMTLVANWKYIDYIVTFKNDDGTILETQEKIHYGDSVTYHGEIPVKPNPVDHYIYSFNGWDVDITNIKGDTIAIAQYEAIYAPYTANFLDENDNIIYSTLVKENENATFVGDTPTKPDDDENQLQYQFSGWKEISRTNDTINYKVSFESCTKGLLFQDNSVYQYVGSSKSVTIPGYWNGQRVLSISEKAFENSNIEELVVLDGVTTISDSAFINCEKLVSVTLPESFETFANGTSYYEGGCFRNCSSLTTINIPKKVSVIGSFCFSNCSALKQIELPDSIVQINNNAFEYCSSLENITFSKNLVSISNQAFYRCASLESIIIPDSVESICNEVFYRCSNVEYIELGANLKSIGSDAFSYCSCRGVLIIPENISYIGRGAFGGCYLTTFLIKHPYKPKEWDSNWDNGVSPVIWGYESIITTNGYTYALFSKDEEKCAYVVDYDKGITSFELPNSIDSYKVVGASAYALFRNNSTIKSIVLPTGISIISNLTFTQCVSLETIVIPEGIESIGDNAFKGCISLTSVSIPNSVLYIGSDCFRNCSSLRTLKVGNSVSSIGEQAFWECNSLQEIILSKSITTVGNNIFTGSDNIQHIFYEGTQTDWEQVSVGSQNDFQGFIYYYSEAEPQEMGNYWHYVEGVPTIWPQE